MLNRLRGWCAAAFGLISVRFDTDDEELRRRAMVLNQVLLVLSILLLIAATVALPFFFVDKLNSAAALVVLAAIVLSSRTALARGRITLASLIVVVGLWLGFTAIAIVSGGILSANLFYWIALTAVAGLLLGQRGAAIVALISLITGLVLVIVDLAGYPPIQLFPSPPITRWIALTFALALTIAPTNFALQGMARALAQARQRLDEKQLTEQALRASEEFLQAVVDSAPLGITVRATNGRLLSYNQVWQQIWGFSDEYIAQDMQRQHAVLTLDATDDYSRPWWDEILRVFTQGGTLFIEEAQTGQYYSHAAHWVSQYFYAIANPQGAVDRVVVITQDITKRKLAEQALQENEERLQSIAQKLTDLIFAADATGRLSYVSPASIQLFGIAPAEAVGQHFLMFLDPHDATKAAAAFQDILAGRKVQRNLLLHLKRKDGSVFQGELNAKPFGPPDAVGLVGVLRDVSERLMLEAQLRQSQKMEAIGTLAGGIAHDFNNILFAIMGNAEMAMEALGATSPGYTNLQALHKAGLRAKDLVQQILAFSRKTDAQPVPLAVTPTIHEVIALLRGVIPSTIEIQTDLAATDAVINADRTELHQVLMNLCVNAVQAMADQPGVLVIVSRELELAAAPSSSLADLLPGQYIVLSVRDTGSGMPPEIVQRVFEPYFTTKEEGKGTGLGLAVVHGIVTRLGGAITVESQEGTGSTFTVYLPAEYQLPAQLEIKPAAVPHGTGRVLVVDDEPDLVLILDQFLTRLGYQVEKHTSSQRALESLQRDPQGIDLLITDQTMPRMTGVELARAALAIRPDLPIILCTGYSQVISAEQAQAIGICTYLPKPVSMRDLAQAAAQALRPEQQA